ncbi:MAG TPA: CGNR zinc finger domain-containing protein [Actinomycetota bacterium]
MADPIVTTHAIPTPGHFDRSATPAPGDLELLRSFVSLHDHAAGTTDSTAPSAPTFVAWFRAVGVETSIGEDVLALASQSHEDLRTLVLEHMGSPRDDAAIDRLDELARMAGVAPSLARDDLAPAAEGALGMLGRILAIAFLARRDGTFDRLRTCSNQECLAIFYDRSKNRSGRWCDMRACGTQAKVRAYRARQRAAAT